MHIPDGFINGQINVVTGAAAAAAIGVSAWRASREVKARPHVMPLVATTAAFVFAAQMLNFPIGGGTSGHFLGAVTVAALLGPWSALLVMTLVLTMQCLGFADGGVTALGTNIFNMGIIGGFVGYLLLRALRSILPAGRFGYLAAVAVVSWISVVLASTACALELSWSGTSPLAVVFPAMVGTHAIIGIGEAIIAVAVVSAVAVARPDVLPAWANVARVTPTDGKVRTAWTLAGLGLLAAVVIAVFLSPFASGDPDGLEKIAGDKDFLAQAEGKEVYQASPLPNYAVAGIESEGFSTGLAGLLGTVAVFVVGFIVIRPLATRLSSNQAEPPGNNVRPPKE